MTALHPIQAAELILIMEAGALQAEDRGDFMDAECIRNQSAGLIEAIAHVEAECPGYAAHCIQDMTERGTE